MYVKQNTEFHLIPERLKQTFHHEFNSNVSKNVVLEMYHTGRITERDLSIIKFLFIFKFATAEQVASLLGGEQTIGAVAARLDKLVNQRILNKFLLSPVLENRIYPDALQIYSLDLGAKHLLTQYSRFDVEDWVSSENYKTSDLIAKDLITVNFYLALRQQMGQRIEYFRSSNPLQLGRNTLSPSCEFSILGIADQRTYMIGEVVQSYDMPFLFRERAAKLESLLMTNAWKKFFFDGQEAPFLLLICENDLLASEAAELLSTTTDITRYRLTTLERMQKPLHEVGAFLRYDAETGDLYEVASQIFAPEK